VKQTERPPIFVVVFLIKNKKYWRETKMTFKDRLEYIDQCVAGEKERFQKILSIRAFNSFDRSYELFRDYIKQKNTIKDVSCDVSDESITIHIASDSTMEELLSDSFPKKGVVPVETETGIDLHISLIESLP